MIQVLKKRALFIPRLLRSPCGSGTAAVMAVLFAKGVPNSLPTYYLNLFFSKYRGKVKNLLLFADMPGNLRPPIPYPTFADF